MDPPNPRGTVEADSSTGNEAFQLLSNETRLRILQTLWEHTDPTDPGPMRFSELREHLAVDDPGRLNIRSAPQPAA